MILYPDPFLTKVVDRRRPDVESNDDLVPEEIIKKSLSEDVNSPEFQLHVLLLVIRKIIFISDKKVEIVNNTITTTIQETPHQIAL